MPASPVTIADVRTWARDNGHTIGNRGRIKTEVVAAYNKANPRRKYAA